MTEHTPGPWQRCFQENGTAIAIRSESGQWIADVVIDLDFHDSAFEQQPKNANLMAAAPELLEACHAAILAIQGMKEKYGTFTSHELDAAKKQAVEAVERAGSKVRDYVVEW